MVRVLIPVQEPVASAIRRPPRPGSLNGKVVGLYDNGKLNARRLLQLIAEELQADGDFRIQPGEYWPERLMQDGEWGDVDKCDVVLLANGDCGACSSSGI